jgi:predicted nucleotidyltransferase
MTDTVSTVVSTKEVDYLDEDKQIRGQNYVCLSFISPEDVLADKNVYAFSKYLQGFAKNMKTMVEMLKLRHPEDGDLLDSLVENNAHVFDAETLQEDYRYFVRTNTADIDREFLEKNDFRTCVRGIKVRGSFETLKEAQVRAEVLKRMGDKFDIFIGQVGCWCPWSPNPEDLEDQEYAETQLNTLMKKYKENAQLKDNFFEQRKQEKIDKSLAAKDAWTQRQEALKAEQEATTTASTSADAAPTVTIDESPMDESS